MTDHRHHRGGEWRFAAMLLNMNRGRIIWAVFLSSLTLLAALGLAGLSAWLIARTWQKPLVASLTLAVTAVRGLGVGRGLFRYADRLASHTVALGGLVHARETLYRTLASGDPSVPLRMRKGDFLARIGSGVDDVGDLIVRGFIPLCVAGVLDCVAIVWMFILHPLAGVIMTLALLLSGVVVPWLSARQAVADEEAKALAEHDVYSTVVTLVDHAPELSVRGELDTVMEDLQHADERTRRAQDKAAVPAAWASTIGPVATWTSVLCCLILGLWAYARANGMGVLPEQTTAMQPTIFLMMVLLPFAAFEASDQLPTAAVQYIRSRSSLRRLRALWTSPRRTDGITADPTHTPALHCEDVVVGWSSETPLITPFSLMAQPGGRYVLVGPSGVGKTTLLATMAGLLQPLEGTVTVGERPVGDYTEASMREVCALFPEDAHIFDTTILENLRVIRGDITEDEALAALESVGLGEWCTALPQGMQTRLVGGAEALSGGERRRLLLARAVCARQRIILLDEPTEHLDREDIMVMMRRILDPSQGLFDKKQTVIVVTHVVPPELPDGTEIRALTPTPTRAPTQR